MQPLLLFLKPPRSFCCCSCCFSNHREALAVVPQLVNHRSRLENRLRVLEVVTAEVEEDQTAASQAQHELEQRIKDRVAVVTSWLKQAEHAALSALKATAIKVRTRSGARRPQDHRHEGTYTERPSAPSRPPP